MCYSETLLQKCNIHLNMLFLILVKNRFQIFLIINFYCVLQLILDFFICLPTWITSTVNFLFLCCRKVSQRPLHTETLFWCEISTYPTPVFYVFLFEYLFWNWALFCLLMLCYQFENLRFSCKIFCSMTTGILIV